MSDAAINGAVSLSPRPASRTPVIAWKVSRAIARGHHVPQARAIVARCGSPQALLARFFSGFLGTSTGEDVVHAVVALVTRVLVNAVLAPLHRNLSSPWFGPGRRILDC